MSSNWFCRIFTGDKSVADGEPSVLKLLCVHSTELFDRRTRRSRSILLDFATLSQMLTLFRPLFRLADCVVADCLNTQSRLCCNALHRVACKGWLIILVIWSVITIEEFSAQNCHQLEVMNYVFFRETASF
jgi:hypothetical protein